MPEARTSDLLARVREGVRRAARRGRPTLVSVTTPFAADPCATVFSSRLDRDRWFCWEEPDRGFALAALGVAHEAAARGPDRFRKVADDCLRLGEGAICEQPENLPVGAGPIWTGGFSFDPGGSTTPEWISFPAASMVLPELSLCRLGERSFLTLNAVVGKGVEAREVAERVAVRLSGLEQADLPHLDLDPWARPMVYGIRSAPDFERAVAAAGERISAGRLDKVVLAREVLAERNTPHDPAAVFGALREIFPACFCFCCGTPHAAFLGASPELLVRRSGARASTVALAGSAKRSSDFAVDHHLGEQLLHSDKDRREHHIVAERIVRALRPHAVWVEAAPEPEVIKVANVQHLATPVIAQLAEAHSAVELAGILHPTPAVGGEPAKPAAATIAELEEMDRGWYAGPVGWMDTAEDGEFCVALRSALLRDREAHVYAGVGIVDGSDPTAEFAETQVKLGALLPLLTG